MKKRQVCQSYVFRCPTGYERVFAEFKVEDGEDINFCI